MRPVQTTHYPNAFKNGRVQMLNERFPFAHCSVVRRSGYMFQVGTHRRYYRFVSKGNRPIVQKAQTLGVTGNIPRPTMSRLGLFANHSLHVSTNFFRNPYGFSAGKIRQFQMPPKGFLARLKIEKSSSWSTKFASNLPQYSNCLKTCYGSISRV